MSSTGPLQSSSLPLHVSTPLALARHTFMPLVLHVHVLTAHSPTAPRAVQAPPATQGAGLHKPAVQLVPPQQSAVTVHVALAALQTPHTCVLRQISALPQQSVCVVQVCPMFLQHVFEPPHFCVVAQHGCSVSQGS